MTPKLWKRKKANDNAKSSEFVSSPVDEFGSKPIIYQEDSLYNPETYLEFPSLEACNQENLKFSDALFSCEVGESSTDARQNRDVAEINKDSSANVKIKNDLEFTEWKDPVWQQPHSSRISPVPLGRDHQHGAIKENRT